MERIVRFLVAQNIEDDRDGQVKIAHSIAAGLDYPGVGPEHAYWKDTGRVRYESITDKQALEAYHTLARLEGILPALEPAHAIAYLPRLASGPTLLKLNARMAIMGEGAGFVGPGLAGTLLSIFSAPFVLVADALTFAVSYVTLRAIRTPEPAPPKRRNSLLHDLREGVRAIWVRPNLRLITIEAVNGNIAFSIMIGQAIIFQRIDLGFDPALIGAVASIGFLGGLVGSLAAPQLLKRLGFGPLLLLGTDVRAWLKLVRISSAQYGQPSWPK